MSASELDTGLVARTAVTGTAQILIVAAAVLGLLLAAMDATMMGTVLPRVIHDVGDSAGGGYAWLVSGFLLAQVAAIPVAGWFTDWVGDRVIAVTAALVFLGASVLAGFAGSFEVLVGARVLHGLAAGALVVSSYVIVGRTYGPERRAAAQGLLSTVWGVAAVMGPVLGAVVTTTWGWRWMFFLNVPLCIGVALILLIGLPRGEPTGETAARRHRFPVNEYSLLIGGVTLFLLALQGRSLGLGVTGTIVALVVGVGLMAAVKWVGGKLLVRAALGTTPSGAAALATVGACMVMYATVTVLPVQLAKQGVSITGIAVVVGAAAIGWVFASALTGGMLNRGGYRLPMTLGGALLVAAASLAAFGTLPWVAGVAAGLGTGAVTAAALALMQDQAPPQQLGVATSSATLLRNLGAAVGINGLAALAATASSPTRSSNPAFWTLAAVALLLVVLPALFVPGRRTVLS